MNKRRRTVAMVAAVHGRSCFWCGRALSDRALTLDHVVPSALGGTDAVANLVPSCRMCNKAKGDDHPLVWLSRISTHRGWPKSPPPSLRRINLLRRQGLDSCGGPWRGP